MHHHNICLIFHMCDCWCKTNESAIDKNPVTEKVGEREREKNARIINLMSVYLYTIRRSSGMHMHTHVVADIFMLHTQNHIMRCSFSMSTIHFYPIFRSIHFLRTKMCLVMSICGNGFWAIDKRKFMTSDEIWMEKIFMIISRGNFTLIDNLLVFVASVYVTVHWYYWKRGSSYGTEREIDPFFPIHTGNGCDFFYISTN